MTNEVCVTWSNKDTSMSVCVVYYEILISNNYVQYHFYNMT